ncbi:Palmitoyltransferase ZDHHC4 [Apodemus speciosus]|uniref:Palmitoyltransferase n=1 Tax=Apodemus speciosus TaxID=105296 RepID=A0ABQ0ETS2_APOSI
MDFLVLFLFYLAFLLICVIMICIFTKSQRLTAVALGGAQVHPAFVGLHLLLQGLVYAEYTCEVFGYCRELEFSLPCLLLPYLLLSVNLVFFTLTCAANPGTITKANESLLLQVYKFDAVMFPKNSRCSTCGLRKPARSKHCRVCDRCVHRFDHHCVWVNNCIGAWNTRYFLVYLLTLTASAASIAILSAAFLLHLVAVSDLYQETYLDDLGHFQAVDTVFLVQADHVYSQVGVIYWVMLSLPGPTLLKETDCPSPEATNHLQRLSYGHLFLAFPRIVFLLGFVVVLSLLLAGYLCFVLYLAATNQTTNEWYKGDWAWCQHWPLVTWSPPAEPQTHQNIHSHGFWGNLREIFLPTIPSYKKKKK